MGAYSVPELPFAYDALEPHIDEQTLRIHHTQIHQTYVDRLNEALQGTPELRGLSDLEVEDVLWNFGKVPSEARTAVRHFGGGHANHRLFWSILSPNGGGEPTGELAEFIDREFGSFKNFKERFAGVAMEHFGSGWVWLVRTRHHLIVYALPNEDSPLTTEEYPLLGLDLWEHGYFLRHETRRAEYVEAFWNVVDWDEANRRYIEGAF
jgi:Fe-Mn family superoxide dismutase